MTERVVGLTACSKSKQGKKEPDREFPARDLYDSWLFDGRVDALKAHCDEWAIFSAKHGYVEPDDPLTWYDKRITDLSPDERRELAREVVAELPEVDRLMILMGRDYADPLKAALPDDVDVWDPLEGVGLFDQRGELRDLASETEQTTLVTDGGRDEYADGFDPAVGYVRASRLYDLDQGETIAFDWPKLQPVDESQNEVERAVAGILDGSDVESTG